MSRSVIVLVRVLTLGTPDPAVPDRNVINGLGYMWDPKPPAGGGTRLDALRDPQVWMEAAGQTFFSLSVGFGIIFNDSSYLRRRDDVVLSGLAASSTNVFFDVCLGGLITIPAAFIFLGVAGVAGMGTFGLGFNTLPVVFLHMPLGRLFGFIWFFMPFLAAITSSLSMLQPAIAFLEEALTIGRRASVAILGMITALGSLFVIYISRGLVALDTMDFWVGTASILVLATLQVILFSWVLGVEKGCAFAQECAQMRLPRGFEFMRRVDRDTPADLDAHCIVDNDSTHKHPAVKRWLKRNPRFHLHFIPTSSSWLNLVERWFREITTKRIRRESLPSVAILVRAIEEYLERNNQNPKPFIRTGSVDQILGKVSRCKATLETLH